MEKTPQTKKLANCSLFTQSATLNFITGNLAVVTLTGVQVAPASCIWDQSSTSVSAVPACAVPGMQTQVGNVYSIDIDTSACAKGTTIYVTVVLVCECNGTPNYTTIDLTATKP